METGHPSTRAVNSASGNRASEVKSLCEIDVFVYNNVAVRLCCVQECIDEEEDMTDSCSGVGRRELEADSGISRTDDSLRNDESSEHELIDTDSASPSSGSTKYDSEYDTKMSKAEMLIL